MAENLVSTPEASDDAETAYRSPESNELSSAEIDAHFAELVENLTATPESDAASLGTRGKRDGRNEPGRTFRE